MAVAARKLSRHLRGHRIAAAAAVIASMAVPLALSSPALAAGATYSVGPITNVSTCAGQNAEVEQAADRTLGYVYETWMGCQGIAFARSTDGGHSFGAPISVPGSV